MPFTLTPRPIVYSISCYLMWNVHVRNRELGIEMLTLRCLVFPPPGPIGLVGSDEHSDAY